MAVLMSIICIQSGFHPLPQNIRAQVTSFLSFCFLATTGEQFSLPNDFTIIYCLATSPKGIMPIAYGLELLKNCAKLTLSSSFF